MAVLCIPDLSLPQQFPTEVDHHDLSLFQLSFIRLWHVEQIFIFESERFNAILFTLLNKHKLNIYQLPIVLKPEKLRPIHLRVPQINIPFQHIKKLIESKDKQLNTTA